VIPHVCAEPALTATKESPPATATGLVLPGLVVPSPSCKTELSPQQYAAPLVVRPHVCTPPGVIEVNASAADVVVVIAAVPLFPSLVAVIVAEPGATPVTSPTPDTVATAVLSLAHVAVRPVNTFPAASFIVAVNSTVSPIGTVAVAGVTVTEATGVGGAVRSFPPPQAVSSPPPQANAVLIKRGRKDRDSCRKEPTIRDGPPA
jgi:hypothetical protein